MPRKWTRESGGRIPLLGTSERHAEMGALVSLYFASSEDIGHQAGELVNQILEEERGQSIPYTSAREVKLVVNLKTAKKIGMEIPSTATHDASDPISWCASHQPVRHCSAAARNRQGMPVSREPISW